MTRLLHRLVCVTSACLLGVSSAAGAVTASTVELRVPAGTSYGSTVTTIDQLGTADVVTEVIGLSGGVVKADKWRNGSRVFALPAFTWSSAPPRGVLRVTPQGSGDALAPRWRDFEFGADFRKDSLSSGTSVDNGDNLIQRGLWNDPSQYKIEVDGGRPGCRVKGDRGSVAVRAAFRVDPNLWYRVRCKRVADTVSLMIQEYRGDGSVRTVYVSKSGTIGSLVWPKAHTPLSVGGKLKADGSILSSATDQFNGLVSQPILRIYD